MTAASAASSEGGRFARRDGTQLGPFGGRFPPIGRHRRRAFRGEQLLPRGPQHFVRADALNQPFMQLMHQPVALRLIDDEGEIQIVRRLRHEINLVILEQLERRSELVEYAADVMAQQAHRGAGPENFHPAEFAERIAQSRERG